MIVMSSAITIMDASFYVFDQGFGYDFIFIKMRFSFNLIKGANVWRLDLIFCFILSPLIEAKKFLGV